MRWSKYIKIIIEDIEQRMSEEHTNVCNKNIK